MADLTVSKNDFVQKDFYRVITGNSENGIRVHVETDSMGHAIHEAWALVRRGYPGAQVDILWRKASVACPG
jgi:hypothetical protein